MSLPMLSDLIKHLVLTGASGLIGSRVLNHLHAKGYGVTAIDIGPLLIHVPQPLRNGSTFTLVDRSNASAVEVLFATFASPPDGLVHVGKFLNLRSAVHN